MNRFFLLTLLALFLFSGPGDAQVWKMTRYEAIAGLGGTFYMGDIGSITPDDNLLGLKDVRFRFTRPVIHLGARYKLYERISVKLNINFGWLYGIDDYGSNEGRGIEFSTFLFEPTVQGEYSFIKDRSSNNYLMMKSKGMLSFASAVSFYGFAGFGPVIFSPKVIVPDPSGRTEEEFSNVAMAFPLGIGVKYGLTPKLKIGFEFGGRFTTTDHLDSFTSQQSRANDVYYFGTFQLVYALKTNRNGWPKFSR